jgi:low temperature requirement protein LtrA
MASTSTRREPWITPPRPLTAQESGERRASWLELFFDLVVVALAGALAAVLVAVVYAERTLISPSEPAS